MSHTSSLLDAPTTLTPDRPAVVLGRRTGTRIRLVNRASPGAALASLGDRRRADRVAPEETPWSDSGRLRTGHDVRVLDISTVGVLMQAPVRLHVGGRVEVCLTDGETDARLVLAGVVRRCHVAGLNPMTYTGALEFDQAIDPSLLQPFVSVTAELA